MPSKRPPTPPTRGRPALTDEQIGDMRRHISVCALRLFQESGYGAVSMRRLAAEAGCTPMTIYRYFDRKIDILRALWAEVFTELFDKLDGIALTEVDPVRRLHAIALGYVTYWLENREHYFMVFMSSGITETDVSIFVGDEPVVARFSLLRETLTDALVVKSADANDVELRAQLLLCLLNGIAKNLITIAAYPWAEPGKLVHGGVAAILR